MFRDMFSCTVYIKFVVVLEKKVLESIRKLEMSTFKQHRTTIQDEKKHIHLSYSALANSIALLHYSTSLLPTPTPNQHVMNDFWSNGTENSALPLKKLHFKNKIKTVILNVLFSLFICV